MQLRLRPTPFNSASFVYLIARVAPTCTNYLNSVPRIALMKLCKLVY